MSTNIAGNMLGAKYNKTEGIESDYVREVWSRGYVRRKGGESWCQITKEPDLFHVLGQFEVQERIFFLSVIHWNHKMDLVQNKLFKKQNYNLS